MRLISSCLLGFLAVVILASEAQPAEKIRFVTLEFAPFIYGENQQVAGPGRDIIEAVCAEARTERLKMNCSCVEGTGCEGGMASRLPADFCG